MRAQKNFTLAVLLAGLCWSVSSSAAHSDSNLALQYAAMRTACADRGGRLEKSWMYNDQGVRWGRVVSCSTSVGFIRCENDLCRINRWGSREGAWMAKGERATDHSALRFEAEPKAFFEALVALSSN
jgi:hypothetical protein